VKKFGTALFLSSALLLSTSTQAAWQGNWVAGVTGGYSKQEGEFHFNSQNPAGGAQNVFSQELSTRHYLLGLLGGYQVICNGWLWGLELNVDWQNKHQDNNLAYTDVNNRGWEAGISYERDYALGLTGRLGYQVSSFFLPYVRVGAQGSRDKLHYYANNTFAQIVDIENRKTVYRFVGGVGAELPIPVEVAGLTFRAEYNYEANGGGVTAVGVASDNTTLVTVNMKPHSNVGKVSVVWNFS
jgi:opacity protein-like surface antigen